MGRADSLEKTDAGKDWGQEKGTTEEEIVGWHQQLDGHKFEQTQGGSEDPQACSSGSWSTPLQQLGP